MFGRLDHRDTLTCARRLEYLRLDRFQHVKVTSATWKVCWAVAYPRSSLSRLWVPRIVQMSLSLFKMLLHHHITVSPQCGHIWQGFSGIHKYWVIICISCDTAHNICSIYACLPSGPLKSTCKTSLSLPRLLRGSYTVEGSPCERGWLPLCAMDNRSAYLLYKGP